MDATSRLRNWLGGTPAGVWTIKHLVSPLDRRLYGRTGGRLVTPGHPHGPIVLLTTIGRRTATRTRPRSSTSRMGSGSSCAMSPRAASGPTPGRSTWEPSPWRGSSSAPRSEPIGRGRPPRPSSSVIGPNSCASGRPMSASIGRAADARSSCSTPHRGRTPTGGTDHALNHAAPDQPPGSSRPAVPERHSQQAYVLLSSVRVRCGSRRDRSCLVRHRPGGTRRLHAEQESSQLESPDQSLVQRQGQD
jgi:hypothetical protein